VRCAALQLLLACASPMSLAGWRARVLSAGAAAAADPSIWRLPRDESEADIDRSRVRLTAWLSLAAEAALACSGAVAAPSGAAADKHDVCGAAAAAALELGRDANAKLPGDVASRARDASGVVMMRNHLRPLLPGLARDAWAAISHGYATASMSRVFLSCIDTMRLLPSAPASGAGDDDGGGGGSGGGRGNADDSDRLLLDILGEGKIVSVWLQELSVYRKRARESTSARSAALDTEVISEPAEPPPPLLGCRPVDGQSDPASTASQFSKDSSEESARDSSAWQDLCKSPGSYFSGMNSRLDLLYGCLTRCGPLLVLPTDLNSIWTEIWSEGSTPGERGRLLEWLGACVSTLFHAESIYVKAMRKQAAEQEQEQ